MSKKRDWADDYESLHEAVYGLGYDEGDLAEKIEKISMSLEAVCEILEKLLDASDAAKEKIQDNLPAFKIGADIGGELKQEDLIAKIFGN